MVVISALYIVIGTYLSNKIAMPLVSLENIQEQKEAQLRKAITYAVDTKNANLPGLDFLKGNWIQLAKSSKNLSFFTNGYMQGAIFVRLGLLLPPYLTKQITFGSFIQTSNALQHITDSLSLLVSSRDIIVDMKMLVTRLEQMEVTTK